MLLRPLLRKRWVQFLLAIVGVYLATTTVCQLIARGTAEAYPDFSHVYGKPDSRQLVVIVHGAFGDVRSMDPVRAVVQETFPAADVVLPVYSNGALSNADPRGIASAIEEDIDRRDKANHYDRIILVGYSLGAQIVRQVYLYGVGGELALGRPTSVGLPPTSEWVRKVDRIVLLAGMNRGWSVSRDGSESGPRSFTTSLELWLAKRAAQVTGVGKLGLATERGAPFVADVRANWVRLMRRPKTSPVDSSPIVVQLLGADDELVSKDDNSDVGATPGFYFIGVEQTTHADMKEVASGPGSAVRRAKFIEAISADSADLQKYRSIGTAPPRPEIRRVVFVMHGIRDYGYWTQAIDSAIMTRPGAHDSIDIERPRYTRLPMLPFLVSWVRESHVRWFMDRYTEVLAQYPNATISYVGHSNGTYMLAKALRQYRSLRVQNVLFAGSVLPLDYDWNRFVKMPTATRQVQTVRNIEATNDWVVAIFPHLYESIAHFFSLSTDGTFDLGAAGFRGFDQGYNIGYTLGPHSAAIDAGNSAKIDRIAAFMLSGNDTGLAGFREAGGPNSAIALASQFCWLVWIALIGAIYALYRVTKHFIRARDDGKPTGVTGLLREHYAIVFSLLVVLVLLSV